MKTSRFNRRSVLRGMLGASSVGVALPLLDAFLDGNGQALADGAPIPVRFGTYFWGLGLTPGLWTPSKTGAGYDVPKELSFLNDDGLRDKVSIFSGFTAILDGRASYPHWSGMASVMTGQAPGKVNSFDKMASFDTVVADSIGKGTRFKSLEVTPYANASASYSSRGEDNFKPADNSPLALYTRIFGSGFQDPNNANWKPDPSIMVRKSVLSSVKDQRDTLMAEAGHDDRQRLDQYFTSVRELEQKFDAELTKPAPAESCTVPTAPQDIARKGDMPTLQYNNKLMSKLVAMAFACNQTKVVNYVMTTATSEVYRPGDTPVYHAHTHEEPVDTKLGYQPISQELAGGSVGGYGVLLKALNEVKEGDGTLLDRSLILGYSDTGWAKIHSIDSIPMMLAGGAGGRHKAGQHIRVAADPVTRVSLTAQQLVGVPTASFGTGSMATSKPISEVIKA